MPLAAIMILIMMSGWLTIMETALEESHRTRLEKLTTDEKVLELIEEPENLLTSLKLSISLIEIVAGVVAILSAPVILKMMSAVMSAIIMTIIVATAILFLGRILPEKLAKQEPEVYIFKNSQSIRIIGYIMRPTVLFMTGLTSGIMTLLGKNTTDEETVTEDEVKDLIEQGREAGTFEKEEQAMVDRIFQLGDETAYSLMTPRTQIVWLDLTDSLEHNLRVVSENKEEILPVGEGSLDECRGVLYTKDLLNAVLNRIDEEIKLSELLKKPMYVPRSMEAFRLLEKFRNTGVHEAMVLDEYGGVTGFITLQDILYEMIGSYDIIENDTTQFSAIGKDKWFVDGLYYIDDFKKRFNVEELPEEEHDHFQTMGGFLTSYFGRIPNVGDKCEWNGFIFEVARMDRARIDKFYITKNEENE